ncbi:MAG: hypothetical protein NC337_03515 [Roseburia sp.]|nr:hypothetical protein [Roseburia sp.]
MGNVTESKVRKFGRRMICGAGLLLLLIGLDAAELTARAEEQSFEIEAELLPSDKDSLDVLLTIENLGADWEGTARLTAEGIDSCTYDTALSLPQGSAKQFVVRIPQESVSSTDGIVEVSLLDKKSALAAKKEFRRLLQGGTTSLSMGILSDDYAALTYMDMGGGEYDYNGGSYPIKLVRLDRDNLTQTLDALTFLVIDDYDTGVLPEETVARMEGWVENGGILLVGTGSNAEDTLRGLAFLELQCDETFDTGAEAGKSAYDYRIDVSLLSWAELIDAGGLYEDVYMCAMLVCPRGFGAVGVLPYTLAELGRADLSVSGSQENVVRSVLDSVGEEAALRYAAGSNKVAGGYSFRRAIRILGNGSERLNFSALRLIVVLYVIFVGPVLYLILRQAKKRDLYWVLVPASALAAILLVWFAGRGFEVADARVYSVTIQDLSGGERPKTYLRCYDSGNKPWRLRLAGRYDCAGPAQAGYYNYIGEYHITKEGERLFLGLDPTVNFQDGHFMAVSSESAANGSLSGDIEYSLTGLPQIAAVTNGTDLDFAYLAVVVNDNICVYKDFPAGETRELSSLELIYDDEVSSYMYGCAGSSKNRADMDVLTALGMGIMTACGQTRTDSVAMIGVTENWDKAVEDTCKEIAYGCFYTIQ